jgi:hypothetical protein
MNSLSMGWGGVSGRNDIHVLKQALAAPERDRLGRILTTNYTIEII